MKDAVNEPLFRVCALSVAVFDRVNAATAAEVGLGGAAAAALLCVDQEPGMTIDQLATLVGVSGSGAVRLVDRLDGSGLVERRAGTDGRTRHLYVTTPGRRAARRTFQRRNEMLDAILTPLDDNDRRDLQRVTDKMLAGIEDDTPQVAHLCRLCDLGDCPEGTCPVRD